MNRRKIFDEDACVERADLARFNCTYFLAANMSIKLIASALLMFQIYISLVHAAESAQKDEIEAYRQDGYSINEITPIFSQLLVRPIPKNFKSTFENLSKDGSFYIHEFVQGGESTENWSEMLTDTGIKDMASNPKATPQALAFGMADGFKKACPNSFGFLNLGAITLGDYDAFAIVASCGTAPAPNHPHSESALIVTIKGEKDYYSVQWAERGTASKTPITLDRALWADRLKKLQPIKLCPMTPGEQPPYPSCVGN